MDRHLGHVHAHVALPLPAARLVDEITHETFASAFRRMDRFTAGTHLHGWLPTIATNLVRKKLARSHREEHHRLDELARRAVELAVNEDDAPVECSCRTRQHGWRKPQVLPPAHW